MKKYVVTLTKGVAFFVNITWFSNQERRFPALSAPAARKTL